MPNAKPAKLVLVRGLFDDGNAFYILGKCRKAARKAGWSPAAISDFSTEAKAGDYDHLLQTVMKYFEEADEDALTDEEIAEENGE